MFSSIYSALSGLLGFSKGLDVISNNVANLNTPGFKSSDLAFGDLFYRYSQQSGQDANPSQVGQGVNTKGTRMQFSPGQLRDTGNPLDVAVEGNGFLVVNRGGESLYTRAGQLQFGPDGLLATANGDHVMALANGVLTDIGLDGLRTFSPKATSLVRIGGSLSTNSTTASISSLNVIDVAGRTHSLALSLTRDTANPQIWAVEARDATNAVVGSGQIQFQADGSPAADSNSISFNFAPSPVSGTTVVLNFGDPGTFSGTTNFSGATTSQIQMQNQNGFGIGSLTTATFDVNGSLKLSYSNGQTAMGSQLALGWFDDLQGLIERGDGLFESRAGQTPILGVAGDGVMGRITAQKIELSNVQLAQQFTDLIVMQRGYQASSQITSVSNEMIQQLLEIDRRR
jgi:flagellar hook protein FlgE